MYDSLYTIIQPEALESDEKQDHEPDNHSNNVLNRLKFHSNMVKNSSSSVKPAAMLAKAMLLRLSKQMVFVIFID